MSMNDKPALAALLDASRLLSIELLWDPDAYPCGPQEPDRDIIMAALAVGVENYRSMEVRPDTLPRMRATHGRAFRDDADQIVSHAAAALAYHADMLTGCESEGRAVEDAAALVRMAVSILATYLAEIPYRRVDMTALMVPCGRPGCGCGGEGGADH